VARERFPRRQRIGRGTEIRALLRGGVRSRTRNFDVFREATALPHARFGVIVPKYRHSAVERNQLKRRLREVARRTLLPVLKKTGGGLDVMVRARPGAYDLTYEQIQTELAEAVARS